jgi:hypothetical protein
VTKHYLLAFGACDQAALGSACNDVRNKTTYLAQSDDGVSWSLVPGWPASNGSVPDVIRRGSTIYFYVHTEPGSLNQLIRYHVDTGVLDPPVSVAVTGLGSGGFVDPSLIQDADGSLVLFFLPGILDREPAGCLPTEDPCLKHFQSATEVAGSDGASSRSTRETARPSRSH